jgi:acetyl-CoA acetyltransferase
MSEGVVIAGAGEVPYQRKPDDSITTGGLLAQAMRLALDNAGLSHKDIDGLGVASQNLKPDRVMDLAWHLGLKKLRWAMDGPPAMNVVHHAVNAVQAGDAEAILIVAGDRVTPRSFEKYTGDDYNVAHRDYLRDIPLGGPNVLYALITQEHMKARGLSRETYGGVVVSQRRWAGGNPTAIYRTPLTMDEYLAAPMVADPLTILDCVPLVAGADAVIVSRPRGHKDVQVRAIATSINHDGQEGETFGTGLADAAPRMWAKAGLGPEAIDLVALYDDYPVVVLAQLEELGFVPDGDLDRFVKQELLPGTLPVNTSGGLLTAGQPGSGGGLHGLVECVRQLRCERGEGQIANARRAIATGYGMIPYRHGAFVSAILLERNP